LWNFAAAGLLLWLSRRYKEDLKPGALFAGWLLLAGFGRVMIEFFRPDQPKIPGLGISYSSIVAALMAITGAVMLMARYKAINLKFAEDWEEEYKRSSPVDQVGERAEPQTEPEEVVEEEEPSRLKKGSMTKAPTTEKATLKTTRAKKLP
jgi:hypothetical protein